MERWQFDWDYERVRGAGCRFRMPTEAWTRLIEFRSTYGQTLQALIDYLLAPGVIPLRTATTRASLRR